MPTRYSILAIVIIAALLWLFPIWFGLPHLYARPDEEVAIAKAVGVLNGDFNPHFFHWPSLTFYLFAAMFALARGVRAVAGLDPSLTGAQQLLIARACIACAGAATIYVLFRIGTRIAGAATGLLAALFLAVAVLHVRDSHFAMTDVLMTLFVMVSLALILRGLERLVGLSGGSPSRALPADWPRQPSTTARRSWRRWVPPSSSSGPATGAAPYGPTRGCLRWCFSCR